jgi:hypothetical protein
MTRKRASTASLAFATALAASAVSAMVVAPIAHADPLDAIRSAVNGNRSSTACKAYTYSGALEGAAQAYARSESVLDGTPGGYNGRVVPFLGSGDPQAAAINSAYRNGAGGLISNCDFTEFGVGFIRHEDREVDVVTIVFGAPAAAPKVVEKPAEAQTKPCEGGAPVPIADTCPVVEKEVPPPSPDSITMDVQQSGSKLNIKFTNSSDVAGSCDYVASPTSLDPLNVLPTIRKTVQVKAKGTGALNGEKAPPLGTSYHIEATCTGTFKGASVPLGGGSADV